MSAQYVRDHYRVPAKRGGRIRYSGRPNGESVDGTIVGFRDQYLRVRFDDPNPAPTDVVSLHPTWAVKYL